MGRARNERMRMDLGMTVEKAVRMDKERIPAKKTLRKAPAKTMLYDAIFSPYRFEAAKLAKIFHSVKRPSKTGRSRIIFHIPHRMVLSDRLPDST